MKKPMKMSILLSLLGLAGAVAAQTTAAPPQKQPRKGETVMVQGEARLEADAEADAKTRAQLDEARKRLDEAARQVAELSNQLARSEGGNAFFIGGPGPQRAILGVQVDPESGKDGARVLSVSPGGAAEEAGIAKGDVIVSLDGKSIAGGPNPNRALVEHMRGVKPDQQVKVRVVRAGKNKDFVVAPRSMVFSERTFNIHIPDGGVMAAGMPGMGMREFHTFWPGEFGGMELASITPKLGTYFGTNSGVLVVQAPENSAFKLEDGDVIQGIDGRKPDDGPHALRILRSYKPGEKLSLAVLRQRKPVTLAITMPERPEFDEDFMMPVPPVPPVPPQPPMAPMGSGGGTFE